MGVWSQISRGWFLVLGNSGRYLAYIPSLPQSSCPGEPSPVPRAAGLDRYMEILREGFDCLPSKVQTEAPRIPVLGEQSVQARRDLPASSLQGRRSPAESEDRCRQVLGWNQALGLLEAQEGGDGWNGPWQLSGSSQG